MSVTPLPTPRSKSPELPPSPRRPAAWREVRTPGWLSIDTRRLGLLLIAAVLLLALVPWQQAAPAAGEVVAWVPEGRQQPVEAPIDGRVVRWFIREGQTVKAGDPLVEVQDVDDRFAERLESRRGFAEDARMASAAKVAATEAKLEATRAAREAALMAADAKVREAGAGLDAAIQDLAAAEATERTARVQRDRAEALLADGLRSIQEVENARLKYDKAAAELEAARADKRKSEAALEGANQDRLSKVAEFDGKIAAAQSELEFARGEQADKASKVVEFDSYVARQDARVLKASRDGVVVSVYGGVGGEQVKRGDILAHVVPEDDARAVALYVDGLDIALVRLGEKVRLQFEGFPAVQVVGWPSVAVGTFGGEVAFIDPVDDGNGRFRVLIRQDPEEPAWPDTPLLRQGLKSRGWIMLSTVPMGWEVWRRFNDFPASVPSPPTKEDITGPVQKSKAGEAWKPK